jgi:hypothetical protein
MDVWQLAPMKYEGWTNAVTTNANYQKHVWRTLLPKFILRFYEMENHCLV